MALDISAFEAAWQGDLSLLAALRFIETESATSKSSSADPVRSEILGFLLQALPTDERSATRRRMLSRVGSQRGPTMTEDLTHVLTSFDGATAPSVAVVEDRVKNASSTNSGELTPHYLAEAQPEGVAWLVLHPDVWPLSNDDAYRFLSDAIQREDAPLQGITVAQFKHFLELNVDPGRYDNIASKFARACDEHSLGLAFGY